MTPGTAPRRTRRPSASAPVLFAVDVGNSETTLGVFQDDQVALHWRLRTMRRTPDEIGLALRQLLAPEAIDLAGLPAVIGSVVPDVTSDLVHGIERLTGRAPLVVTAAGVPMMANRYRDPSTVGADRLANALAARERYGAPAIVVDVGTATTFDVVGPDGDFLGGAIALGLGVAADELFRRAARLGRVELSVPEQAIGRTTDDGMRSGLVLGHAAMIDGMVSRILAELGGRAHVVATGGLVPLLRELTGTIEHFDPDLTLHGLRIIHEATVDPEALAAFNRKQEKRARDAAKLVPETLQRFEEPEIDERDIHVVTGPGPTPKRDDGPAESERPARGARGGRGRNRPKAAAAKPATPRSAAPKPAAPKPAARPRPEPVPEPVAVAVAPEPEGANGGNGGRRRRRGRRGGRRSRR